MRSTKARAARYFVTLMILGARDVGARDIPNNDEGWGRIDQRFFGTNQREEV